MPVKIRCRGCKKTLNAPDKARGRVIKCPQCQTKLKVPGDDSAKGTKSKQEDAGQPRGKKVKAVSKPPGSDSDFFANLDLDQAEHHEDRICPFCAADLSDETDVCPECGMNTATRQMDAKVAKQRSRKGPPASAFYKNVWRESFGFMKENKSLAMRTGGYWGLFSVLSGGSAFMAFVYCQKGPPIFFWSCLTLIFTLGIPGWYWFLSEKIIRGTLQRQEKFDRIHFDFFKCVTLGFRVYFWPAIVALPFTMLSMLIVFGGGLVSLSGAVSLTDAAGSTLFVLQAVSWLQFGFLLLIFPLAMVHQTAKYTYKSWIGWEMLKVLVKNFGPSLYWCMMALVTFIIPIGGIFGGLGFALSGLESPEEFGLLKMNENLVASGFRMIGESTASSLFSLVVGLVHFVVGCVLAAPVFLAMGFSVLFLIRANGLMGLTFQREMMLVQRMSPNTPATFWVRLLAFLVDAPLTTLTLFLVTANKRATTFAGLMWGVLLAGTFLWKLSPVVLVPPFLLVMWYIYFVVSEQTTARSTIGKDGFGLIVSKENDGQMSYGNATIRLLCGLANVATLGVGFVMCAFHPQKKALNDILSKTKVVWRGDR